MRRVTVDDYLSRLRCRVAESLARLERTQELIADTQALAAETRMRREIAAAVATSPLPSVLDYVLERTRDGPSTTPPTS